VLVERDARMRTAQQLGRPGVARFDRQPAQILAVELEQVEEHGSVVVSLGTMAAHLFW